MPQFVGGDVFPKWCYVVPLFFPRKQPLDPEDARMVPAET